MRTMAREASRKTVTAVHAYEDCSLWSFREAKRLGKVCIYDLPIGYYPFWQDRQNELAKRYADWLPANGLPSSPHVRPAQKAEEMELADLVFVASSFVRGTVEQFLDKPTALAPYGVDLDFWCRPTFDVRDGPLRFIYAGQCSLRKGIPVLLESWKRAALKDATLELVGSWALAEQLRSTLPSGASWTPALSAEQLRVRYLNSDVFVFPSFFEGFGLVILEAMACGLPVITTEATAGPDVLTEECGSIFTSGDVDGLVERLRMYSAQRTRIASMGAMARAKAQSHTWENYRSRVTAAVTSLC